MKKIAALLLTLSLVLSILVPEPAEAKTVQKRFTMRVRELKRLTIKNAKKRVAWKTLSGKNKIRLYKGEKKSVFILAKKKGTVRLQAKTGKKKIVFPSCSLHFEEHCVKLVPQICLIQRFFNTLDTKRTSKTEEVVLY